MVKKTVHGIETCEDCNKIFMLYLDTILKEKKNFTLRFNELLKLSRKMIDPKYSAARLQRHLKGLQGKFLKRTKKGKQQVEYSIILPKLDRDIERLDLKQRNERLSQLRLDILVDLMMYLYRMTAVEQICADIESLLNRITPQQYSVRMTVIRSTLRLKMNQYLQAMKDRSAEEYIELLKMLRDERTKIADRLVGLKP